MSDSAIPLSFRLRKIGKRGKLASLAILPVANRYSMTVTSMDRKQLNSLTIYSSTAALALMALVCRAFVGYQGQAIQLLLVTAALASVVLLIGATNRDENSWTSFARYSFASLAVLNLIAWSSSFAFALLLTVPVVLSISFPRLFQLAGWKLELNPLQADPATLTIEQANSTLASRPTELVSAIAAEESTASSSPSSTIAEPVDEQPAEDDPWSTVQQQFSVDTTLAQNVTQWQQPDGSRSVVANVRCRFSAPKETCVFHLPFWPLFTETPEVFCRVASGPNATIKATDSRPHGLRIELRLEETPSSFPVETIVEVVATCEASAVEQAA